VKLITKEIIKRTPKLGAYAVEDTKDVVFTFKLFTPWSNWTWYISEANFETGRLFGLCCGFENEWGYVDLNELMEIRGPFGLKVERDLHFDPITYDDLLKKIA